MRTRFGKSAKVLGISALCSAVLLVTAPPASADWNVPSNGSSHSKALNMPAGEMASASATGRNVTVSWPQSSLANGSKVRDYRVTRYDSMTGASSPTLSSCEGTVSALRCTENGVPPGTWRYAVAPLQGNWTGAEGAQSAPIVMETPELSFSSPTNLTALPSTLNGHISGFMTGQSVTFRLDNATTGTVLSGTVASAPIRNDGQSDVAITIPSGIPNGTHTVYAVGSQGDVAQADVVVNVPQFTPTNLALNNASTGTTGLLQRGDSVVITYSDLIDVSSMCSTWTGNGSNQTISGGNVLRVSISNNAVSGNDSLTVVAVGACGNDFNFGTINLGHSGFVTGDTLFSGSSASERSTTAWNPGTRQLTISLGAKSAGPNPVRVNSSVTSTYTPDAAIRSSSGAVITGTATRIGVAF